MEKKNRTIQYRYMTAVLLTALLGSFLICLLKPSKQYSDVERRELALFPEISAETIADSSFMQNFEKYALDQFPLRDELRGLKAWVSEHIFGKKDDNGIYVADGYAVKMEYPMNQDSLDHAAKRFQIVYDKYLKGSDCSVYLSVIPDKNYFLAEEYGYLSMDYEQFAANVQEKMPYADFINIYGLLSIEDYYKTDIHWRQEQLVDVAEYLADSMGVELNGGYDVKELEHKFHGVYSGQTAAALEGETLYYLTNDVLEQCVVHNYENDSVSEIYNMEKAAGKDPYDMFLSGPVSLLTIENQKAEGTRELIVFRDSFGSSLMPLLAEGYSKITLVDIRYMQSGLLERFLEFENQDVLFLYSTSVLNHSETLK